MLQIIKKFNERVSWSMYRMLTKVCLKLNPEKNSLDKDVGCGKYNRHQTTASTLLSRKEVKEAINVMKLNFKLYGERMIGQKRQGLRNKLQLFYDLQQVLITNIPGIAQMRSMHLILLSSLVGILPLEFYINVPMHHSEGPRKFLELEMDYNNYKHSQNDMSKIEKLLTWTTNELNELQHLFTKNLTANMFENAACMISRSKKKVDVFYFMPWYNDQTSELTSDAMQLCFRVKREGTNTWNLEAFDGKNTFCFLSTNSKKNTIVQFSTTNYEMLKHGHMVDKETLRRIFH